MLRLSATFCLLSIFLCSVGCRTCSTPYDCRVPANTNRLDDYRGFNSLYRGGSIYTCEGCRSCQTNIRNAYSTGYTGDYYTNAGNYGYTAPVTIQRRNLDGFSAPRPRQGGGSVAIPLDDPGAGYGVDSTWDDGNMHTLEQLLQQQQRTPDAMPIDPPPRPRNPVPTLDPDTIPFTPSDGVVVPPNDPFPTDVEIEVPITLEELRRLDPSVQEFEIISIEDSGMESPVR